MDVPKSPQAVAAFAAFLTERLTSGLGEVAGTLTGLLGRRESGAGELVSAADAAADRSVVAAARELAMVIVGAAAPFAPTAYSRARLIRQMHASGLLTDEHVRRAHQILELERDAPGASR